MLKGELKFSTPVEAIKDLLSVPPAERPTGWGELFCAVQVISVTLILALTLAYP